MPPVPISPELLAAMWVKTQHHAAGFISALVRDAHDADDLLQEVAATVVRKREEYDPERPFEAWVIGIAKREVFRYRREKATDRVSFNQELLETLALSYEMRSAISDEHREALNKCFGDVAGQPREVMQLRYVEGCKPAEIGSRMNMSANAVSAMLYRTRKGLHDCVTRHLRRTEATQ